VHPTQPVGRRGTVRSPSPPPRPWLAEVRSVVDRGDIQALKSLLSRPGQVDEEVRTHMSAQVAYHASTETQTDCVDMLCCCFETPWTGNALHVT
jgi:hypothetical protein